MRKLMLAIVALTAFAVLAQAQTTGPSASSPAASQPATSPADPLEASRKIEDEIAKLADLPVVKELTEIKAKLEAAQAAADKMVKPLQEQYQRLLQSEAGKSYEQARNDLAAQRQGTWEHERAVMAEAARKIYSARHEELRKGASQPAGALGKLGFDVVHYPRIDGSTSTHPLSVIIACRTFDVPYEWTYAEPTGFAYPNRPKLPESLFLVVMDGWYGPWGKYRHPASSEFDIAAARVVAKPAAAGQERMAIIINSLLAVSANTHAAYENLINGTCDLNLTARGPSEDELKLAREKGVKIELKPIARDALVFIVNCKNEVTGLTHEQVTAVYEGKIKTWPELGWTPQDKEKRKDWQTIWPLGRERNSGSRELFDSLVMKGRPLPGDKGREDTIVGSMSGPYNQVTAEPQSLGYSVYYYDHYMAASPYTRTIAIDGVEPTAETIASGKYPLVADVFAAYRAGEAADSPAMKMLNWLISEEGQAVIKESGYVPAKK